MKFRGPLCTCTQGLENKRHTLERDANKQLSLKAPVNICLLNVNDNLDYRDNRTAVLVSTAGFIIRDATKDF